MTANGKIKEIKENIATIEVFKESACTGKCEDCAGCKTSPVSATAYNEIGAKVGDVVEIYAPSKKVMKLAFLVYVVPVLILIFGGMVFSFPGYKIIKSISIMLLICLYICFIIYENNKSKKNIQNTITRVIKSVEDIK